MSCVECGTCRAVCGVDAISSDCRFPEVVLMNFESNPFSDEDDFFEPEIDIDSERDN